MTAQIHELLLLDGEWTSMASEPPLPPRHPRVVVASEEMQKTASRIIFSTACGAIAARGKFATAS
jgi:hypothetical protein